MEDLRAVLDELIDVSAGTLSTSFARYWPTFGDTGAHERNLSLHMAGAFLNAGFSVWGEGHAEGDAAARYDLLAYSKERDLFVVGEFKQLWSRSKAREMRCDVARLFDFQPVRRCTPCTSSTRGFGIVAAFSEDDDRFRQLTSAKTMGDCSATRELVLALPSGVSWGFKPLCDHGRHPGRQGRLHLLYAIVEIPLGILGIAVPSKYGDGG